MSTEPERLRRTLAVDGGVRTPKAAEQIAGRLRGQIVRGEVVPGSMLKSEKELLADFGVSRPTLREAFRILESEGLIVVVTGARGGARVQMPDLASSSRQIGYYLQIKQTTMADLLEARTEFEPTCARLLAQRHTLAALAQLEECLAAMRVIAAAGFGSPSAFVDWVDLTRNFHELIAENCGNNTLAVQARALGEILRAHYRISLRSANFRPSSPDTGAEVIADYAALLELVRARDGAGAQRHWREHLLRAAELTFRNQDRNTIINLVD
ncbi:FCD domain-containing protein [Gordonia sp. ABSL1-1]|uniref:FadR/GntR family transcriptional regulator n=1 Tax=Gordonia sp. ABSL1-1 TaxID=3053923 RepID=UPI00257288AC|nr:FCD domain-containing protein [Gordonia sp. ABSL1-1]MDL9938067.1 FCD domain-containing protein [Gordonia sp. ABSL1-1]